MRDWCRGMAVKKSSTTVQGTGKHPESNWFRDWWENEYVRINAKKARLPDKK
jgi:hypothetical protein